MIRVCISGLRQIRGVLFNQYMCEAIEGENYFYSAYGLNIASDIYLPELLSSESGEDVSIQTGNLTDFSQNNELKNATAIERPGISVRISPNAVGYHWTNFGSALIRHGREVIVSPKAGIENTDLSPFITGTILAVLLHQRGLMVLHGSAVVINGEAVAFLGDKGAGKSTLAAYLQTRGHRLLTDDLVPLVSNKTNEIRTIPGFPRIRLWADSVESIGKDPQELSLINRFVDKYSYRCFENFSNAPVKLNRLYVLEESDDTKIEQLKLPEAFIELARHTYLGRYLRELAQTAEHFNQCSKVVSSIPIFKLQRPHDFTVLSKVAAMIETHAE